ncbi:hypothetical protein JJC03_03745 [Flavobacterium oreochromis]|uniref:RHS repeat domain-containing protein n=1 Tax=Flavobacterium oreochromis TaxID=2906078 RepID=UPI001CE6D32E|nr:RHS repeat-associated core domain-containing protein [Flavobacterium oreochromis]QYS87787.1 hypothetical protein JJC03_03745 [Flavobacterium oreochromis]
MNYYPFGSLVPNRHGYSKDYRYGFQGQEKDDELKGEGNYINFTYRGHDPRVGRFFAVDPLTKEYPHYSPYSFSGNKPIQYRELEGLEEAVTTFSYQTIRGSSKMKIIGADLTINNTKRRNEVIFMVVNGNKYRANSYETTTGRDRGRKDDFNGNFSGIKTLNDKDLSAILGYADFVFEVFGGTDSKEQTVIHESNASPWKSKSKLLDFKNSIYDLMGIDENSLIGIDGVAYNANEVGNYLWGMILEEAGVILDANTIAELETRGRNDEPHEQKAITAGRNKEKVLKVDKTERKRAFEYYKDEYQEHLKKEEKSKIMNHQII